MTIKQDISLDDSWDQALGYVVGEGPPRPFKPSTTPFSIFVRGVATGVYIGIYTPKNQSTLQIFTSYFVHMWDINMFWFWNWND